MMQLSVLVLLLCYLQCQAAEITPQKDFDMNKYVGRWHGIAAGSNCEMFMKMKNDMTSPTIVYAVDKDHSTKVTIAYKTPKGCQQMDAKFETIANGHYKHKSVHGDNDVIMVGTDYNRFALEYTEIIHESKPCITVKLFGRDKELPDEVKKQFLDYCKNLGMTEENIVMFSNKGDVCNPHPI